MKFFCPHCTQSLEIADEWAGHTLDCPSCNQAFSVPAGVALPTRGEVPGPPNPPRRGGSRFGKLLVALLVLAGAVFGYAKWPEQVRKWLNNVAEMTVKSAPSSTPNSEPTPPPQSTQTPSPTPDGTAIPAPTSVDPLAWLLEHKERAPKEVALLRPVALSVSIDGKVIGSLTAPTGAKVRVDGFTSQTTNVRVGDAAGQVPIDATNLRALAKAEQEKAKHMPDSSPLPSQQAPVSQAAAFPSPRFAHPGLLLTREDLEILKANIKREPWKSGYAALAADGRSQLTYVMQGPFDHVNRNFYNTYDNAYAWKNDMQAVFNLALMWSFTGDARYAQKSHDILIAWATKQTVFNGVEASFDLGDYAYCYAGGADILRGTWSGWTFKDTETVKTYFKKVFSPGSPRLNGSGSQGMEGLLTSLAVAVFCDDTASFQTLVSDMLTDADSGLRDTLANGQVGDSGRDPGHTALYINNLALIAEIFWKQGVDLYSVMDNRILAVGEYCARFNVPGPTPPFVSFGAPFWGSFMTMGGTPRTSGQSRLALNILHGAYTVRKGIPAPWIERYRNDQAEDSNSFIFRKSADSSKATPPPLPVFPPVASVTTGLANADLNGCAPAGSGAYANGTWTLTGGYNGADPWTSANGADTVHFAYKTVTGNFTMLAKVTSVTGQEGVKAGIMARDSLGNAAYRSWVGITPKLTYERAIRGWTDLPYGANAQTAGCGISQMPYWVKMERVGTRLQTFVSQTGGDWSPACVAEFDKLPNTLYVGLFTLSFTTGTLNKATFTHVSMTGGDGGNPTAPDAPFSVLAAGGDRQVQLRWNESFGATGYRVKRSTTSGGPYTTLATASNTTYTDANVANGTTYYYVVSAENALGESANCREDAATPQAPRFNIAFGGSAEGSPGNPNDYEGAVKAFDLNPGTKWLCPAPGWLQYDFGAGKAQSIKRYTITSANDVPERDPQNWQFQGSNNGSTWTTLDTRSDQSFAYRFQTLPYEVASPASYRYYRLNITANHGDGSTQLSELGLFAEEH